MSKYKSLPRRKQIESVAFEVARIFEQLCRESGLRVRYRIKQSRRTGSAYLKIQIRDHEDVKIKDAGFAVRVSDHRPTGCGRINFSQPARRFYGVCCFEPARRIADKVNRIGRRILDRADCRQKPKAGSKRLPCDSTHTTSV